MEKTISANEWWNSKASWWLLKKNTLKIKNEINGLHGDENTVECAPTGGDADKNLLINSYLAWWLNFLVDWEGLKIICNFSWLFRDRE